MEIQVKHSGHDISSYVVSYNREHKICSGVGTLELELDYNYSSSIDPWDVIEIHENGNLAGKYYVSSSAKSQPNALITVSAQDNSKRLSDYFIPDSYLIDYPSYAKYWIDLFLTEAGISHTFSVEGQGALLSNNTSLGLTYAYENVMQLLQMCGWYITFSAGGSAIIGKLVTGSPSSSFGNTDIVRIEVDKNDRMYRNKVVVWGAGDPATSRWVFAEVEKSSKWDYDELDKRTILISNSNIPSVSAAFMLANQALSEFSRLTIEKTITVEGARNVRVGNTVAIRNRVFTGKGLVTTLSVSMSKAGLLTTMVLDERCPRLFNYYNPGGWVYVSTFGSGVWRKHILSYSGAYTSGVVLSGYASGVIPSGWFDYSSGIKDLQVTDLHVNAGLLSCVSSDGTIYYSLEDETTTSGVGPVWSGILLSGLQVTYSGTMIEPTIYSGLMGRACIIDRDQNQLRYAVDTRSGINYGDFLMETDQMTSSGLSQFYYITPSGISPSFTPSKSGMLFSDNRSWIIDSNPYDGSITDAFPVWVSGIAASGVESPDISESGVLYNFTIYDIENDGTHDYVEAMTLGSGSMPAHLNTGYYLPYYPAYGFGGGITIADLGGGGNMEKRTINTVLSYSGVASPELQTNPSIDIGGCKVFALYDEVATTGKAYIPFVTAGAYNLVKVTEITQSSNGDIDSVTFASTGYVYPRNYPIACKRVSPNNYRFYFISGSDSSNIFHNKDLVLLDFNTVTGVTTESRILDVLDIDADLAETNISSRPYPASYLVYDSTLVAARAITHDPNGFDVELIIVDLDTGKRSSSIILEAPGHLSYPYDNDSYANAYPGIRVLPNGETGFRIYGKYLRHIAYQPSDTRQFDAYKFSYTDGDNMCTEENMVTLDFTPLFFGQVSSSQLSSYAGNIQYSYTDYSDGIVIQDTFDGFIIGPSDTGKSICNFGDRTISMAYDEFNCYELDPVTMQVGNLISPIPSGYTGYAGRDSVNNELFFNSSTELGSINSVGNITRRNSVPYGRVVGNFRVSDSYTGYEFYVKWVRPNVIHGYFPMYMVLQRDGWDYNVIKSGVWQDRLDISSYSPLVTMDRRVSSTETFFISSDDMVTETTQIGISGYNLGVDQTSGSMFSMGVIADDFRYADFEDTAESGSSRKIIVAYSGNLGAMSVYGDTAFSGILLSPSGYVNRVETSNYYLPDQFVFVSVSGYTNGSGEWGFYQKSPSTISGVQLSDTFSGMFIDCSSGYPQARTTRIRLDDRL